MTEGPPGGNKVVEFRRPAPKRDPAEMERLRREGAHRDRMNIAALVFAVLLVSVGWLLLQKLGQASKIQDCFLAGRTNCAPIAIPRAQ